MKTYTFTTLMGAEVVFFEGTFNLYKEEVNFAEGKRMVYEVWLTVGGKLEISEETYNTLKKQMTKN